MKLTDTQLVILSAAAKREGGQILPLPKSLKMNAGAITLVLKSLLKRKLVAEAEAAIDLVAWREDKAGCRFALAITPAGLEAIGAEPVPAAASQAVSGSRKLDKATKPNGKAKPAAEVQKPSMRPGTKLSLLIELMRRKTGTTIEEAATATGWQHHSVRGAISGALKKKMGLDVTSAAVEGRGRVYRIAGS